jgi:dGTPase
MQDASIRLGFEELETKTLSKYACKSQDSLGRERQELDCHIRTCFQRDVDRITHCESFRRLKHKTQVFLSPTNDHFRTRLTHTLEVVCTARCIARCLGLNEYLTEAIAMGHDLGHTPFGHSGETVLNEISDTGFHHASHSVRVVTKLEKNNKGLNLTKEVVDGILKHSKGKHGSATFKDADDNSLPLTVEAQVVRIADLVAYINHDVDDAIRAGLLKNSDLPKGALEMLGERHSVRIHNMIKDIIVNSTNSPIIQMSAPMAEATNSLKSFLYEQIYTRPEIDVAVQKSQNLLRQLAEWYIKNPDSLLKHAKKESLEEEGFNRLLIDYLAGMTDDFALRRFQEIFIPHYYSLPEFRKEKLEQNV